MFYRIPVGLSSIAFFLILSCNNLNADTDSENYRNLISLEWLPSKDMSSIQVSIDNKLPHAIEVASTLNFRIIGLNAPKLLQDTFGPDTFVPMITFSIPPMASFSFGPHGSGGVIQVIKIQSGEKKVLKIPTDNNLRSLAAK
ncbi:MAG TPA: hypothetical protein VGF75_06970, partial [Candidatus Saccharimonadales bacterium]